MSYWIINLAVTMLSFVIAGVSGIFLIPFLRRIKFGQPIKTEDGPQWHAKKQGTPTMGGFMFIIPAVIVPIIGYWICRLRGGFDLTEKETFNAFYRLVSVIVFSALFGLIGFIDDHTKVVRKQNDGLSPMQKIVLQVIFSVGFLFALYKFGDGSTKIDLGFWSTPSLGIFYYILMIPVIIYLTNAVNLTDASSSFDFARSNTTGFPSTNNSKFPKVNATILSDGISGTYRRLSSACCIFSLVTGLRR